MRASFLMLQEKFWAGIVIGIVALFMLFTEAPDFTLQQLDMVILLTGLALISITFILGPASKFWPETFEKQLPLRRAFGLSGFSFLVLHFLYILVFIHGALELDLEKTIFANPNIISLALAFLGVGVFYFMGITSSDKAVDSLGYMWWKRVHTTGYFGLVLMLMHFFTLKATTLSQLRLSFAESIVVALAIIAVSMRVALPILNKKYRSD